MLQSLRRGLRFLRIRKQVHNTSGAWFLAQRQPSNEVDFSRVAWLYGKLHLKSYNIDLSPNEQGYFYNDIASILYFFDNIHVKREGNDLIASPKGRDIEVNILIDNKEAVALILEIFLEDSYRVEAAGNCIVIDIGMNMGLASLYFSSYDNVKKIYSFEPFPATYAKALKNISLNNRLSKKIHPEMVGLGKETKSISVDFNPDSLLSTTTTDIVKSEKVGNIVTIEVRNATEALSEIIETYSKDHKIILKVDCEGAEYEIIEDLNANGILNKIDAIIMEWHVNGPEPIIKDLNKFGYISFIRNLKHSFPIGLIHSVRQNTTV